MKNCFVKHSKSSETFLQLIPYLIADGFIGGKIHEDAGIHLLAMWWMEIIF